MKTFVISHVTLVISEVGVTLGPVRVMGAGVDHQCSALLCIVPHHHYQ